MGYLIGRDDGLEQVNKPGLNQCLLDSAKGGLTAPDSLPGSNGLDEIKEELFWAIVPLILCFMPSVLYNGFSEAPDNVIVWSLRAGGLFFYPMVYMRCVIIGDRSAFNPVAIIFNIIRYKFRQ